MRPLSQERLRVPGGRSMREDLRGLQEVPQVLRKGRCSVGAEEEAGGGGHGGGERGE
jgi:hypothetical protein